MPNSLPPEGICPRCGAIFFLVARTVTALGKPAATDLLEWRCSKCAHLESEERRFADGANGDWPPSRFARKDGLEQG